LYVSMFVFMDKWLLALRLLAGALAGVFASLLLVAGWLAGCFSRALLFTFHEGPLNFYGPLDPPLLSRLRFGKTISTRKTDQT
jgi:hypothetical protein